MGRGVGDVGAVDIWWGGGGVMQNRESPDFILSPEVGISGPPYHSFE